MRTASGVFLAAAAVAAIVAAIVAGGGGSATTRHIGTAPVPDVPIPAQRIRDLRAAAAGAGCTLTNPPSEGREHVTGRVAYRTNPPSSGPHYPAPAHDGIYAPGSTPPAELLVHSLEHGRIEIQYRPSLSRTAIGQLQSLAVEFARRDSDPRVLVFENATAMPYAVAAVAWTHILGCPGYSPAVLDAIRAFRHAYDLKAPERFFVDAE